MDGGRHLAGSARQAPIGHQSDTVAAILQHAQRRHELVEFGHAIGLGPLEADHGDHIAGELAHFERLLQFLLRMEDAGWRLDNVTVLRHG